MYNYNNLKDFIRYGKFHITKQKGYTRSDSYHSPPAPKGFYCMPVALQSMFLVGCISDSQKGKKPNGYFKKDKEAEYDYMKIMSKLSHRFTIRRDMLIWHHLEEYVAVNEIKERSKSWVKTSFNAYIKAVNKIPSYICYDIYEVFIEDKIN